MQVSVACSGQQYRQLSQATRFLTTCNPASSAGWKALALNPRTIPKAVLQGQRGRPRSPPLGSWRAAGKAPPPSPHQPALRCTAFAAATPSFTCCPPARRWTWNICSQLKSGFVFTPQELLKMTQEKLISVQLLFQDRTLSVPPSRN